jgi:hypothetical protein
MLSPALLAETRAALKLYPTDFGGLGTFINSQLFYSWGIRGDNTPEYAEYLGYLSGEELYPGFEYIRFEDC